MKIAEIDNAGNVKIQTNASCIGALKIRPFNGRQFLTGRGNLVNPLGSGWYWLCPFGTKTKSLYEDILDIEAAEGATTRKRA